MEFSGYQDQRGGGGINPADIFSNVQGGAAGSLGAYMNQALVPRTADNAGAYYYSPSGAAGFSGGGGFGGPTGGRAAAAPLPSHPVVPPGSMAGTALPGATPGVPGVAAGVGGGVAGAAGAGAGAGAAGMGISNAALYWLTGISAGTGLLGSWIQANAAKDAAAAQERLGREALALQERMWQQSRGDLAPYTSAGAGASNTLAGLMGIPLQSAAAVPSTTTPITGPGERRRPPDAPILGYAVPRPDAPPAAWDRYAERERTRTAGTPTTGAAVARTSGYVPMRAPTGETAMVAPQAVERALRAGAVRV